MRLEKKQVSRAKRWRAAMESKRFRISRMSHKTWNLKKGDIP